MGCVVIICGLVTARMMPEIRGNVFTGTEGVFDDNLSIFLIETICCDPSSEPSR